MKRKIDKYRKARNKQRKDEPPMPMIKVEDIPDDCADDARLPPEAVVFIQFKDHPVFNLAVQKKGLKKRLKKINDDSSDNGGTAEPDEIGSFTSRKKQRENEKKHWKEERTYNKNELSVKKMLVAEKQADAMARQVELHAQKVKLEFLIKAQSVAGLSNETLRPMFLTELKNLYAFEKRTEVEDRKMPAGLVEVDNEGRIVIDMDENTEKHAPMTKEALYKKYDMNFDGFDWEEFDGFCRKTKKPWVYTVDEDLAKCVPDQYRFAPPDKIEKLKKDALEEHKNNKDFSAYTKQEYEKFGLPEGSWKGISYVNFGMCCAGGHCKMSDHIVDTRFKCAKCGDYAHKDCFKFVASGGGSAICCIKCDKVQN